MIYNYRPISLLCIISKVLERIVYNVIQFLDGTFLSQFDFLPGPSLKWFHAFLTNHAQYFCINNQLPDFLTYQHGALSTISFI